jgi:hypothetical protein
MLKALLRPLNEANEAELKPDRLSQPNRNGLPYNQKSALVVLYRKPSVPISQFEQTLELLGFSKPQENITNPLLAGNLLYKDSEGRIHPSSHRPIYLTIEQEIEKSPWL